MDEERRVLDERGCITLEPSKDGQCNPNEGFVVRLETEYPDGVIEAELRPESVGKLIDCLGGIVDEGFYLHEDFDLRLVSTRGNIENTCLSNAVLRETRTVKCICCGEAVYRRTQSIKDVIMSKLRREDEVTSRVIVIRGFIGGEEELTTSPMFLHEDCRDLFVEYLDNVYDSSDLLLGQVI